MTAGLQRLLVELRREGLAVSPAEWIEALRAVELVGLDDRERVRAALGCTMVKREAQQASFDRVFDRVFAAPAGAAGRRRSRAGGGAGAAQRAPRRGARESEVLRPGATAESARVQRMVSRLRLGDPERRGRLRRVVLDARREGEREAARGGPAGLRCGAPAVARVQRARPRAALEEERALALRIPRLVEQIRLRCGRRRRRATHGRLFLRRVFRDNLARGGVPFVLPRRRARPRRPKVVLLVDVSWSTTAAAGLFLSLAGEFLARAADTRVFLFVDRAVDAGEALERWWAGRAGPAAEGSATGREPRPGSAIARGGLSFAALVVALPGLAPDAASDYGRAFDGLVRSGAGRLGGRGTVLVVLGDGRTNRYDPQAWAFEELARGAGAVLWLVPEPVERWGTGDSALEAYLQHADVAVEAHDAEGLSRGVAEMLRRL